jgi:hypothetical protein
VPFLPCGLDSGVFRRAAPRSVSLPVCRHSWPCARSRGSRYRFPVRGAGPTNESRSLTTSILPWGFLPLRRSQPEESTSRLPLPVTACAMAFESNLVTDFHIRFVPPSSFSTTLTVYSSSSPVACFGHSHPWGFLSHLSTWRSSGWPCDRPFETWRAGTFAGGSRLAPALARLNVPQLKATTPAAETTGLASASHRVHLATMLQATPPLSRAIVL